MKKLSKVLKHWHKINPWLLILSHHQSCSQHTISDFAMTNKSRHYALNKPFEHVYLTQREIAITAFFTLPMKCSLIAKHLELSPRTIEQYLCRIRHRLGGLNDYELRLILKDMKVVRKYRKRYCKLTKKVRKTGVLH